MSQTSIPAQTAALVYAETRAAGMVNREAGAIDVATQALAGAVAGYRAACDAAKVALIAARDTVADDSRDLAAFAADIMGTLDGMFAPAPPAGYLTTAANAPSEPDTGSEPVETADTATDSSKPARARRKASK
jgi:hypothetical protein